MFTNKKTNFYQNIFSNKVVKPHKFETNLLKSDMNISEIIAEINSLLPQLASFIDNFNNTVNQYKVSVITDTAGSMSIEVPEGTSDESARYISSRIGVIDRLITTKGQDINSLLQQGTELENNLKKADTTYVSKLTDKIQEFKRLNASYNH